MSDRKETGGDLFAQILMQNEVSIAFCITGAGNLAIVDAIARLGYTKLIFLHHEQAVVMAAQAYSRVNNTTAVAIVTTGGGTANALTGILSAYMDSDSVLIVSGNESSYHCVNTLQLRAYGVQGFDSTASTKTMTKWSHRIRSIDEVESVFRNAIRLTILGRPGPVHIDFPMDLQRKSTDYGDAGKKIELSQEPSFDLSEVRNFCTYLLSELTEAEKPIIIMGNGCRRNKANILLTKIAENLSIPILVSWSALDLLPFEHPLNIGSAGIYGNRVSNSLLQRADLIISVGSRLAIPQIGYTPSDFGRNATKWYVDIDPTECKKFIIEDWKTLATDSNLFLEELQLQINELDFDFQQFASWKQTAGELFRSYPMLIQCQEKNLSNSESIHSAMVIEFLNNSLSNSAIVVTDVGAGLLSGHQMFKMSGTRRFFTSQGLGEMGFGLPASIGATIAAPEREIVCLNTDGGIMFNLQELQTIKTLSLPVKLFVFNNFGYAMIKISQKNLFEDRIVGSDINSGLGFPNFSEIARAFGFEYRRISHESHLSLEFGKWLRQGVAQLIEVIMDPDQRYTPKLSTIKGDGGRLFSPPLEDLEPLISIDRLEELLDGDAKPDSYAVRNQEKH